MENSKNLKSSVEGPTLLLSYDQFKPKFGWIVLVFGLWLVLAVLDKYHNQQHLSFNIIICGVAGPFLIYMGLAAILNRTQFRVGPDLLTVKHLPIPISFGQSISTSSITQVFIAETRVKVKGHTQFTYDLMATTGNGRNVKLVNIQDLDLANEIERKIERHLNIENDPSKNIIFDEAKNIPLTTSSIEMKEFPLTLRNVNLFYRSFFLLFLASMPVALAMWVAYSEIMERHLRTKEIFLYLIMSWSLGIILVSTFVISLLMKTIINLDEKRIITTPRPRFFRKPTQIDRELVLQVFCTEESISIFRDLHKSTYAVVAKLKNDKQTVIATGIPNGEKALALQQTIELYWQLSRQYIPGSYR